MKKAEKFLKMRKLEGDYYLKGLKTFKTGKSKLYYTRGIH